MKRTLSWRPRCDVGYYALYVDRGGCDDEGRDTVPHLVPLAQRSTHGLGGFSSLKTRATTWTFTHQIDRDHAKEWLRQWAHQQGLRPECVI